MNEINQIIWYVGNADTVFNDMPKQGIGLAAFYAYTGYATLERIIASTGESDILFGLATGSSRMAMFRIDKRSVGFWIN